MKYIPSITLVACLPLIGCGQLDSVLANTEAPVEQAPIKVADEPEPTPLDLLEAELAGLEDLLPELEVAAPVLDGPVPEAEEELGTESDRAVEPTHEAVARWLMDPSLLDDPEAKHFIAVAREIAAIRQDVERLRQTMDAQMGGYYDQLQRENAELRRELRHAYTLRGSGGQGLPMLPVDDSAYGDAESLWADTAPAGVTWEEPGEIDSSSPLAPRDSGVTAIVGSSDVQYAVVAEWGRSPEEVEARGGESSSLRGMVALVPPDTGEEALIAIGHELRAEYSEYDNVNVQIFNNSTAAETYSKTNSMEDGTPVLRISKYRISGEDKVYLSKDGVEVDVTPQQ